MFHSILKISFTSHRNYPSLQARRRCSRSGILLMNSSATRKEINRKTQAFVNFSRSWQPPSLDNLVEFTEGPDSSVVYTPLQPQHAWTIEMGTRGEISRIQWELSLYRSWLRDELLELNDAFGNDIGTTNV